MIQDDVFASGILRMAFLMGKNHQFSGMSSMQIPSGTRIGS
jgi:hypothetical protein